MASASEGNQTSIGTVRVGDWPLPSAVSSTCPVGYRPPASQCGILWRRSRYDVGPCPTYSRPYRARTVCRRSSAAVCRAFVSRSASVCAMSAARVCPWRAAARAAAAVASATAAVSFPKGSRLAAECLHAVAQRRLIAACGDVRVADVATRLREWASGSKARPRLHGLDVGLQQLDEAVVDPPKALNSPDRRADVADPPQDAVPLVYRAVRQAHEGTRHLPGAVDPEDEADVHAGRVCVRQLLLGAAAAPIQRVGDRPADLILVDSGVAGDDERVGRREGDRGRRVARRRTRSLDGQVERDHWWSPCW